MTYSITDRATGEIVGTRNTRRAAQNRADKLDLAYGAIKYSVKPVYVEVKPEELKQGDVVRINNASHWTVKRVDPANKGQSWNGVPHVVAVSMSNPEKNFQRLTFNNLYEMVEV